MSDKNDQDSIENAEEIIERFGGIRPMANKMNVPVTTVQGWKKRNVIPGNRRDEVIEAAQNNDIDLSDLVAGAANENMYEDTPYELAMRAAHERDDEGERDAEAEAMEREQQRREDAREEHVLAAKRRAAAAVEPPTNNEHLIGEIRKAQSVAFSRSATFTIILVAAVAGISAVLLWPTKEQVEQQGQQLQKLQTEVAAVRDDQGFLRGLIPGDLEERFSQIQEQTRGLQDRVTALGETAEVVARDVLDPNASMAQRIERLEGHIEAIAGPSQLTEMLNKVQQMQQSVDGQTQLSAAVGELNALLGSVQGEDGDIQQALQQAQQEDDALGQTLQGVQQQDLKAAALLLGLAQMRSSFNRSAPFAEDLALMQKMLGEDDPELQAAIERLAPKAASGVLTPEGLQGEFKGLAGDIVVASLKGEDVSVQEKARARINNIIQVEKDGELLTGTDTQATVARAQKMLEEGNIQGAVAELQALDGDAAQAAQPFIDEAQVTLIAQQLQSMLTGKVLNRIGGGANLNLTAQGGGMEQLVNEIKKLAPQRPVVREPESGFSILTPKSKYAP